MHETLKEFVAFSSIPPNVYEHHGLKLVPFGLRTDARREIRVIGGCSPRILFRDSFYLFPGNRCATLPLPGPSRGTARREDQRWNISQQVEEKVIY